MMRVAAMGGSVALASAMAAGLVLALGRPALAEVAAGASINLPALRDGGKDGSCYAMVEVQNVGCAPTKLALLLWEAPGACPPDCLGPSGLVCSGLLPPGGTWRFGDADISASARTGTVLSLSARRLHQLDEPTAPLLPDDVAADYLCRLLYFTAVGDCHGYRRFHQAWSQGRDWGGVPLGAAAGEPVAVTVRRSCVSSPFSEAEAVATYVGVPYDALGEEDPTLGGYGTFAPLVYSDHGGWSSRLHVRNAGTDCGALTLWLMREDDCGRARICTTDNIAPGEGLIFDIAQCAAAGWVGGAWLRSTQPMAVIVDSARADDLLSSYRASSGRGPQINSETTVHLNARTAVAPLAFGTWSGWDTGIQVQNLSGSVSAKVRIQLRDAAGESVGTLVDWICPRGSRGVYLPHVSELPDSWIGTAHVASMPYGQPGGGNVTPPPIAAVAHLIRYADEARTTPRSAMAYAMHRETQLSHGLDGTPWPGPAMLAAPSVGKAGAAAGEGSKLAIANVVDVPGFTDIALYLFDENGLVDQLCQRLAPHQVEMIDLDRYAFLKSGFRGSAIVSAVAWTHRQPDAPETVPHRVALAVGIAEPGALMPAEYIPGDAASAYLAVPVTGQAGDTRCALRDLPACPRLGLR